MEESKMTDTAYYHLNCGHHAVAPDSDNLGEADVAYCTTCMAHIPVIGWTSRIFMSEGRGI